MSGASIATIMWRNSTLQTLGFGNLLAFDSVHKWTHLHCRIHVEEQSLHETHLRHLASRDDALRTSPKDGACEYLNVKSSNWIYIAHGQQNFEATHWRTSSCPSSASQHCTAGEPLEMSCNNSSRLEAFGSASIDRITRYALATNGNNKIS